MFGKRPYFSPKKNSAPFPKRSLFVLPLVLVKGNVVNSQYVNGESLTNIQKKHIWYRIIYGLNIARRVVMLLVK